MNKNLGRGFGAASIEMEVKSALANLPKNYRNDLIVFDIGANIGNYCAALIESNQIKKVFCFEPSSTATEQLNNRFLNLPQVHILSIALGKSDEKTTLYTDSDASGLASLTKRRLDHFGIEFDGSEIITMNTLSNIVRELGVVPDFIKIDVEGHELDVLNGGKDVLSEIKLVQFEFGGANIDTRTYFQDFWYFFQANGFELLRITPRGVKPVKHYTEEDEYFKTTNYLARNTRFL